MCGHLAAPRDSGRPCKGGVGCEPAESCAPRGPVVNPVSGAAGRRQAHPTLNLCLRGCGRLAGSPAREGFLHIHARPVAGVSGASGGRWRQSCVLCTDPVLRPDPGLLARERGPSGSATATWSGWGPAWATLGGRWRRSRALRSCSVLYPDPGLCTRERGPVASGVSSGVLDLDGCTFSVLRRRGGRPKAGSRSAPRAYMCSELARPQGSHALSPQAQLARSPARAPLPPPLRSSASRPALALLLPRDLRVVHLRHHGRRHHRR